MRKMLTLVLMLLSALLLYAYEPIEKDPSETKIIDLDVSKYTKHEDAFLRIAYYPYIDECRVVYIVPKLKFTSDEALVVCRNALLDFMSESDHRYFHYFFTKQPDQTIYSWQMSNNVRIPLIKYIVSVKFY